MPHLSPMFWLLSPLMYISILILMMSSMWWNHHPNFPSPPSKSSQNLPYWSWE